MARADLIRKPSFRGVPFDYDASDADIGRLTVTHVFPKRERHKNEDLGRKPREISLRGSITGDDWMVRRDALITAIERPGPGLLVHPLFGEMTVSVVSCRVSETTDEIGVARFDMGFVEEGVVTFSAKAVAQRGAQTMRAAAKVQDAAQNAFTKNFSISGMPQFVQDAAGSQLGDALDAMSSAVSTVRGYARTAARWIGTVNDIIASPMNALHLIGPLGNQLYGLVGDASFLWTESSLAWTNVFGGRTATDTATLRRVCGAQLTIAGIGLPTPAAAPASASPCRKQLVANQTALTGLIRQAALAEAAQATVATPFSSADEAGAARDAVAARIDAETLITSDDDVFAALSDLRRAVVREVTDGAMDLPRLRSITLPQTVPAIVLAHRLYDDPAWWTDIVARNRIRHPGFVPAGRPITVLSDVG